MTKTFSSVDTWNSAACEAVKEMVAKNQISAQLLEELRRFYDEMAKRHKEPDLDVAVIAAMWGEFGARVHASAAPLSGQALLWGTVIDTVIAKQRDYGKENIIRFGQFGLIVRVHDKLARLEHLAASANDPQNESRWDTVLDLVGYSVLGILLARGQFELPLI